MRRVPVFLSTILLCSNIHLYRLSSYKTTHTEGALGGRSSDHGDPGSVPAHFMFTSEEYKVALAEAFLRVLPSFPVSAIQPLIHTHLLITDFM
jgi:hypothetical protein